MADDYGVQIADALVAELNDPARSWHVEFTAARAWDPDIDPSNTDIWPADTWKVFVIPVDLEETKLCRGKDKQDYGPAISFKKRITINSSGEPDDTQMKAASKQVQDVHDWFRSRVANPNGFALATLPEAKVIEAKRPVIYFLAMLTVQKLFETYLDLKVEMIR